jgi:four helix bundle protein
MRDFHDLSIWSKSHLFTLKIYSMTKNYPKEELFGIVSQMRRSASSVPTNIAEGCGRNSNPDFKRFLVMASGSSSELEYQLILSKDLEYISESSFKELEAELIEIRKMIHSFIKNIPT